MASRYSNRVIATNYSGKYGKIFLERNVGAITQYTTPNFKYPTADDYSNLLTISHIWSLGDRFYKLAEEYYNNPALWWLIAWFNRMPTEAHLEIGWIVDIPMPLEEALRIWDK